MSNKASRVLIVDDMPINRIILASLLASNGVNSDQVETGQECLEFCQRKKYDLILLDHRMPELDGVDTLVHLKKIFEEQGEATPVICHTTEDARNNINLYKAAGFADVLIKPIDPKQMSEILMTYLPEGHSTGSSDASEEEAQLVDELDKLPLWLKSVPKIDLVSGIKHCETAEDYLDALFVFASSIETKSAEIESFFKKQNLTMYTLRVHSLKSIARLVGATQLADDAAAMETAGKTDDYQKIYQKTPSLLADYRSIGRLLAPILEEEDKPIPIPRPTDAMAAKKSPEKRQITRRKILFIEGTQGSIINKGIYKHLEDADFSIIGIADEPDEIMHHRLDADLLLYYPEGDDLAHIRVVSSLLYEICRDNGKTLCLIGDAQDIETAQSSMGSAFAAHTYPRPVNLNAFVKDMIYFSDCQAEYRRKKNIVVVDDDPDYLSIIQHWLADRYNVYCFKNGDDALAALLAMRPDLVLLDYEMPDMDGFDLMKRIKDDHRTYKIPIIFLTGKNDRDQVIRILEHKPDGYLLKSSQKDTLLDAIHRFFSESILKKTSEEL